MCGILPYTTVSHNQSHRVDSGGRYAYDCGQEYAATKRHKISPTPQMVASLLGRRQERVHCPSPVASRRESTPAPPAYKVEFIVEMLPRLLAIMIMLTMIRAPHGARKVPCSPRPSNALGNSATTSLATETMGLRCVRSGPKRTPNPLNRKEQYK